MKHLHNDKAELNNVEIVFHKAHYKPRQIFKKMNNCNDTISIFNVVPIVKTFISLEVRFREVRHRIER